MIAKKPPMGWNSWNTFGDKINEQLIKEMADRIVEDGYRDLGYEYIIIDDCWSLRERVDGKLVADPALFPNGMKALADYIHSKGLKFGMYSCAGQRLVQAIQAAMVMNFLMQSSLLSGVLII